MDDRVNNTLMNLPERITFLVELLMHISSWLLGRQPSLVVFSADFSVSTQVLQIMYGPLCSLNVVKSWTLVMFQTAVY